MWKTVIGMVVIYVCVMFLIVYLLVQLFQGLSIKVIAESAGRMTTTIEQSFNRGKGSE